MEIIHFGEDVLRKKADPVDPSEDLKEVIEEMFRVMYEAPGIGLAAPQVGISKRFFIIDVECDGQNPLVFINPVILERKGEKTPLDEGCLSFPDISGEVMRPSIVVIRATDLEGNTFELEADDLLAKAIQHEYDHINGVLFIDHLSRDEKEFIKNDLKVLKKRTMKDIERREAGSQ